MSITQTIKLYIISDTFPLIVAIILYYSSLLDTDMTNHVYNNFNTLFRSNEDGILASMYMGTDVWWISTIGYATSNSIIILLCHFVDKKDNKYLKKIYSNLTPDELIKWIIWVRINCFLAALFPFLAVFCWWVELI